MEIFKLFGSILINTDEADKSLSKTDKNAKSFGETLGNGIKTAGKWAAAVGTAAVGAATGMYKMATNAASTADNIDKMSQKIGISREAYQELDFVLSQSGTDVDKLQTGMKTMSAQVEKSSTNFEKLGVALKDANGEARSQEEIFFDTVNALQKMEEGTEKSTIAAKLFGRAGTELMPLLNAEVGSLEAMREQAHELGLVLDDELVDNGVNLTDALDQMKRSLGSVMTQLGARLMPIVEKAVDFITAQMPKVNKLIESVAPIIEEAFDDILPVILDLAEDLLPQLIGVLTSLLPPISRIFSALAPIVSELISRLAPIIVRIIDKLLPPLVDIIEALMPILDSVLNLLDPILGVIEPLLPLIASILELVAKTVQALQPLIDLALKLLTAILQPLEPLLTIIADEISKGINWAIEQCSNLINNVLMPAFAGALDFLENTFGDGVKEFADGFINAFETAFSYIDTALGTNLTEWYREITAFWRDAGAKLYEVFHAGDDPESMNKKTYLDEMDDDIRRLSNDYMRQGMEAEEALNKAKDEVLNTTEKLAYFNQNFLDSVNLEDALQRQAIIKATQGTSSFNAADYYSNHYRSTPKLASGGVIHGQTLAIVGDNTNVKSDPEVVAPLSELEKISGTAEILDELRETNALLRELLSGGDGRIIMDGEKVASIVVNKINKMRYTRGSEVIFT